MAAVSGFSEFEVGLRGPVTFIGSDTAERFAPAQNTWPVSVAMRGGDDLVRFDRSGPADRYNGGAGRDRFSFGSLLLRRAFFDLSTGALNYLESGRGETSMRVVNFEDVRWVVSSGTVTINGTDGANRMLTRGGSGRADRVSLYGKGGDDILRGGWGYDMLIGGQGHDVADGGAGIDRCMAEVRAHCEL